MRVLIVDDEVVITRALGRLMAGEHDVTLSNDPIEALALVQAGQRFDIVLCDMMMPKMTGVQLHRAIAAIDPGLAAATILMTGGSVPRDAVELLASGVPNLPKPFTAEELKQVLAQVRSGVPGPS